MLLLIALNNLIKRIKNYEVVTTFVGFAATRRKKQKCKLSNSVIKDTTPRKLDNITVTIQT